MVVACASVATDALSSSPHRCVEVSWVPAESRSLAFACERRGDDVVFAGL